MTRPTSPETRPTRERAARELLPGRGGLVLSVPPGGRAPLPPPLRFERSGPGDWTLRQGDRPLIRARTEGGGCCRDLHLHRLPGHRSPLPPLTAAAMRSASDWPHRYARCLEDTAHGPLHEGRWLLAPRPAFAPGVWSPAGDLVEDWPDATLELLCGGGWHGVLPLRPLPAPDTARVKAHRKHARDGTLAPVLLWWVSFLDGWLLLDGHARAAAALAEGMQPPCVELVRVRDDADWRTTAGRVTEAHEDRLTRLAAQPPDPGITRRRQALDRGYAASLSTLPYEPSPTPVFAPAPSPAPDRP